MGIVQQLIQLHDIKNDIAGINVERTLSHMAILREIKFIYMRLLLLILLLGVCSEAIAQGVANFETSKIDEIQFIYHSSFVPNKYSDQTIKHSIQIKAKHGNIPVNFVLYFGDNLRPAEAQNIGSPRIQVLSWHEISEYERLLDLLQNKKKLMVGYNNGGGAHDSWIILTKTP